MPDPWASALVSQSAYLRTLRTQLITISVIGICELLLRYSMGSERYIIILLLAATIYTAYNAGVRQGLTSAALVVVYSYYRTALLVGENWLSIDTLQRGAVVAIAFPLITYVVGRLKERNETLLMRERLARKETEASEKQLRFMAESMPQKIFTSSPNGDSLYTNPQWHEYTDGKHVQDTDFNWTTIIHPDDVKENSRLWKKSLSSGEKFEFQHRLRRNDGDYIWHITRANPLRDEKGKILMWIGSSTDIEDIRQKKRLEADTNELIRQRRELIELNHAKDEFISLASHQLRTPATGVKQYLGIVLDGFAGNVTEAQRSFLKKASESNERQLAVINDLLKVAQIDSGEVKLQKETIDVRELLTDVLGEQYSKFATRNQQLVYAKPRQAVNVDADRTKLRMVLENIIDNASKYTPEGKSISVQLTRAKSYVKISVKDEGVGIAKADKDKVFQKFIRLDNQMSTEVGGTGLGLYWVKRVVELHDGTIAVSSRVSRGSTFSITMPSSR